MEGSLWKRKDFFLDLGGILLVSFLLHFFTLSWELPHIVSPEVDGIPPTPGFTAEQMCRYEAHKYPILQYILAEGVADLFLSPLPEGVKFSYNSTNGRVWEATSERVLLYRFLSAFMGTLAALLLYLMGRLFLQFSRPGAFLGAGMLLFPPAVLHYSHTTNMDVPALFWMTALLFSLLYWGKKEKEGAEKKLLLPFALLSGVLLGCAFATKDQIYAVTILPFFYFVYRKIREKKSFIPTILCWGTGFLFTVFFIYFVLCRDKNIFLLHFKWLVTSGSDAAVYALVSKSITGYLWLFWRTCWDMASAMDGFFTLFLLGTGGYLLYKKFKKEPILQDSIKELLIFTALAFLSHFFFFSFVVRYNYPRYMLTLLPLFALLGGLLFDLLYREKKKVAAICFLLLFLLAAVQSIEYLFLLSNTPRSAVRKDAPLLQKELKVYTALSKRDFVYSNEKGKFDLLKKHAVRDWSYPLGLKKAGIGDLLPEDLHFFLFEPRALLMEQPLPAENRFFVKSHTYSVITPILPRLFEASFPGIFLYTRNPAATGFTLMDFAGESLSWQLVLLHDAFSRSPRLSTGKAVLLGKALAPFREKDLLLDTYWISRSSVELATDLYRLAGRKEDEKRARLFLRK